MWRWFHRGIQPNFQRLDNPMLLKVFQARQGNFPTLDHKENTVSGREDDETTP